MILSPCAVDLLKMVDDHHMYVGGILYVGRACFQALIMICDILILIISDGFFLVMVIFDMHSVTVNILLSCSVSQTQIIYTFRFS